MAGTASTDQASPYVPAQQCELQSQSSEERTAPHPYKRFLLLLQELGWTKEEVGSDVLRDVKKAHPAMQAMLVEDLEARMALRRLDGVRRPCERTSFVRNLLRMLQGKPKHFKKDNREYLASRGTAPAAEGGLVSARALLESLLGDDPLCWGTLHPSHLRQQVPLSC